MKPTNINHIATIGLPKEIRSNTYSPIYLAVWVELFQINDEYDLPIDNLNKIIQLKCFQTAK
jgi:hypothetical protein